MMRRWVSATPIGITLADTSQVYDNMGVLPFRRMTALPTIRSRRRMLPTP
jgi:hypothetical protein